jgi:transcriptional regulator with XRE-family HTH domain
MSLLGAARVSAPVLSELLAGKRGATRATADRIAKALNCDTAVIFPELVEFQATVRVFTARGADS